MNVNGVDVLYQPSSHHDLHTTLTPLKVSCTWHREKELGLHVCRAWGEHQFCEVICRTCEGTQKSERKGDEVVHAEMTMQSLELSY